MKEKMRKASKPKAKAKGKRETAKLHCECGGILKPAMLADFDFTPWAGIPARLMDVPGYRCDTCGGETLPGVVVNTSLRALAYEVVRLPHRLSADLAKYLRRSLEITQQELADRMGLVRETVAQWECGEREISPQQDMILRMIAVNRR